MSRIRALLLLTMVAAIALLAAGTAAAAPKPGEASNEEIRQYYDSGEYAEDVSRIVGKARSSLREQAGNGGRGGFTRRRPPERRTADGVKNPALVLDIDDTSLLTYPCQRDFGDFGSGPLAVCVVRAGIDTQAGGKGLPRIDPTFRLFRLAQRKGVKIFFITGRPEASRMSTLQNLQARGFTGDYTLIMRPNEDFGQMGSTVPYKAGARERIEREGDEIIVNVGDQRSDLKGGHSNEKFKLPNPMYLTE